jgi:sugar phosphate isomerase/epimerase
MPAEPALAGIGDEAATALPTQVAAVERLGWSGIELRAVDGQPLGDLTSEHFTTARRAVRDAGLAVPCLDSRIGNWARPITAPLREELRELDVLAGRAHALGARYLRIMSYPNDGLAEPEWRERVLDRIARLAERAAQHDVVLAHENCSGWAGSDPERMLMLTEAAPGLRLLFDTGNGVAHGYESLDVLRKILPHVAHVHVKDAVGGASRVTFVAPGDGQAQVAECLRLLLGSGYRGALSLEPHVVTRPHEGVAAEDATEPFVHAGQRLQQLLREIAPQSRDPLAYR